jgi:DNA-directed RNA polymerase subunit alpha
VQEDFLLDFHSPKITFEQVNENHGLFVVEPLDRGFGYTFGNSLRRVLLSSLEGAAVSGVKIDGVAHEFSTIRGVTEDVTDIILNLKKVAFVLHGEDGEIDVELVKEGPGPVRPVTSTQQPTWRSSIPALTSPRWKKGGAWRCASP